MKLISSVFNDGDSIPSKYTCTGVGISPPLTIESVPSGTKSFAIILEDPDAPIGTFIHWVVWNIPSQTTSIEENSLPAGSIQGASGTGKNIYVGPCPPSGTHRYIFNLYALDTTLNLPNTANQNDLKNAMNGHIIESTQLLGRYSK